MMASKVLLSFFLIMFSSYLQVGFCDNSSPLDQLLPGLGQSKVLQKAQCMEKLLPCQLYLKSPNNPPQTCCGPLEEIHDNEPDCLCSFFIDPQALQSFNVAKEDFMKLPEACGLKIDVSQCKTGTNEIAYGLGGQTDPAKDNNSASSTKIITPYGIIFGVPGFVALLTAAVFSVY
ncbi:hypothetical protein VNO77_33184 [Canavalia gladiata]|uniref:Bifunctional inhibitor/plant lipid transfer protein/seed storage helical domain-containing protein n=1 Tax=Canavalia gladiata TaxID=3824 RepID=A0AAN9PY47_CANGL